MTCRAGLQRERVQERVCKRVDTVGRGRGEVKHERFPCRLLIFIADGLTWAGNLLSISMRRP